MQGDCKAEPTQLNQGRTQTSGQAFRLQSHFAQSSCYPLSDLHSPAKVGFFPKHSTVLLLHHISAIWDPEDEIKQKKAHGRVIVSSCPHW